MTLSKRYFFGFLLLTLLSSSSIAQTVSPSAVSINGNVLQAKLQVTSTIEIDLVVEFEKSIGLSTNNIEITASLIDIDSSFVTNRFNVNDLKVIPSFPVIISISPKVNSGFGFEGLASVEIYTKSIDYNVAMPARLFRSHDNGNFEDITSMVSAGSIRARGNTGSFSDFMILLDERSNTDMIEATFSQLSQLLNQHSDKISLVLGMSIQTSINSLQHALLMTDFATALELTESLISITESATGDQMSNVWRSSNDVINMQGELLTRLKTLRFSLRVN
jgi:hypothetical protein